MRLSPPSENELAKGSSLSHDAWLRLRKNKVAMFSLWFVAFMLLLCFLVPLLPFVPDPNEQDLTKKFEGPSASHWLGRDQLGRDVFARILFGGQISLLVGIVATAVALVIGIAYGAVSGYAGGRIDTVMMRIVDTLYAIPFLVLVIVLKEVIADPLEQQVAWMGRFAGIAPLFFAIGALGWLTLARITRAQVMAIKEQEFVEAAKSLGLSRIRILFRHIVPNTVGTAVVYATLTIPSFILFEASLSYLGVGIEAPNSSWGILIKEGADFLETQLSLLIIPGLFFSLTLFAFNFLGDGLRDALDVRASKD